MSVLKDSDDLHRDIPQDANGDPIFFILPLKVRASYDRKMAACEAGWRATGDPAFVGEALTYLWSYRQPPPSWLHEAGWKLVTGRRTKGDATRAFNTTVRWMRYEAVRDAKRTDLTWQDAYERAAEVLAETRAAAKAATMEAAYKEVAKDLREGRGTRYFLTPKLPRDGSSLKPSPR
jgi:hypothetical protein